MHFLKYSVIFFPAVLLASCAASPKKSFSPPSDYIPLSQVQISSTFNIVEITRENLALEAKKCVPQLDADGQTIRDAIKGLPNNKTLGMGNFGSANIFMLRNTKAVCLHKSSEKFTIFAAEAFHDTVNPQGIPPDVMDGWYKQIALLIATKGVAKVAYVFSDGDAFLASYWTKKPMEFGIYYSSQITKAGKWEKDNIDAKFSSPLLTTISVAKREGLNQKMDPLANYFK